MADYCCFCDTRRPEGGTNHLILNGGEMWLEFCTTCGDREWLENPLTGERITVYNLFAKDQDEFPYREPTQSFEEWNGELEPVAAVSERHSKPCQPTLADIWPSS